MKFAQKGNFEEIDYEGSGVIFYVEFEVLGKIKNLPITIVFIHNFFTDWETKLYVFLVCNANL